MIIGLLSLRGGVGRSVLSRALAQKFSAPVYELEVGLPKLWPAEEKEKEVVFGRLSRFKREKCDLCGDCVKQCQFGALSLEGETIKHRGPFCHGCGLCKEICPKKAIELKEYQVGEIVYGTTDGIELFAGRLLRRTPLEGTVIKKLKERFPLPSRAILKAPCGLHGEALSGLKEAEALILVTQPWDRLTEEIKLFGELTQGLGLGGIVIVNQVREEVSVASWCTAYGLFYAGEIPYLPGFQGDLLKAWPEGEAFWDRVRQHLEGGK